MDLPIFCETCTVCGRVFYSMYDAEQHCSSPCLLPAPPTVGMPLHSVFVSSPPQTTSTSDPTHTVANYDTMSSRQPGTSTSPDTGVIHPQAASVRHQSIVPPDGSAVAMAPPTCWATYLVQENRQLREQNVDYKFLLCWCLHHLRSHQTPPPSAGDDIDLSLRRIVRHSTVTPPQIDETSSFQDVLSRLSDFYLNTN